MIPVCSDPGERKRGQKFPAHSHLANSLTTKMALGLCLHLGPEIFLYFINPFILSFTHIFNIRPRSSDLRWMV